MSLYNMLFGENSSQKDFLLEICDLKDADFGRYRNIFVTDEHVVIHTRNGGGNREEYQYIFDDLKSHPLYSHDEDDDFDSTYANIYFNHPKVYEDILKEMSKGTVTPSEQWKNLFEQLEKSRAA